MDLFLQGTPRRRHFVRQRAGSGEAFTTGGLSFFGLVCCGKEFMVFISFLQCNPKTGFRFTRPEKDCQGPERTTKAQSIEERRYIFLD